MFELRNEEINVKKILAVINATSAVTKRKPEKIRLAGIRTLTSAIPVQRSNQLSYQTNWELVINAAVLRVVTLTLLHVMTLRTAA